MPKSPNESLAKLNMELKNKIDNTKIINQLKEIINENDSKEEKYNELEKKYEELERKYRMLEMKKIPKKKEN
jgi:hypothetical protein